MAASWKYFDVEDFNNWKRKQGSAYKIPPRANFVAAANYIRNFLDDRKFNWAAMLGLAMACLGSRREMPDIHIVYDDRDFQRIKLKLEADQRVRLAKSMNSLFPSKLLIATGPKYKDADCTENVDVEVDLVPPGDHGTPPSDVLRNNQVMLHLNHGGKTERYKGLNMLYLVKTMIVYCKSQDLVWDPRKDVLFLCQNYGEEIEAIRSQLNSRQVQENFLGTSFVSRLPSDVKRRCYHVLLGVDKEPPPSMSLTPAPPHGHRLTASASDINAKPHIPPHKSTPSLNIMQQSSRYLSPPLPGKPRKQQTTPQSAPPTQTHAPVLQPQNIVAKPPTERDSRSRYRHTSAPNTPNAVRHVSPDASGCNTSRSRSAEGTLHQQANTSVHKAQVTGVQKVTQLPKPPMISSHASAPKPALPIEMRPQRSMPNMNGRSTASVPVFAHGQNVVLPVPKGSDLSPQTVSPVLPLPGHASQRAHPHSRSQRMSHSHNQDLSRPPAASNNPHTMAQPLSPRTGHIALSQLTADAIGMNNSRNTHHANLQAASSGGIYSSTTIPYPQLHQSQQNVPVQRQEGQNGSSTFVFELEASTSRSVPAPQFVPPNNFVAELPAETGVARPNKQDMHPHAKTPESPAQRRRSMSFSRPTQLEVSPVSPPHDYQPTLTQIPLPQPATQPMPPVPHTKSVPLEMLPASLMIGPRRHSPDHSFSRSPPQPNNPPPKGSNYQRYYSAPSAGPHSAQASPMHAPVSMYKAYSGPISPPVQPAKAGNKLQKPPTTAHIQAPYAHGQTPSAQAQAHTDTSNEALPQTILEAAPQAPSPPRDLSYHYLNPVGANRPTQPVSELTKHDSHQDHHKYAINSAGVVGTSYEAYSYHNTTQMDMHTAQNRLTQEVRHLLFDHTHPTQHPQQTVEHSSTYEQNHFTSQGSRPLFEPNHQRTTSHDSQASTASHDSEKLAMEYRANLPDFENGYGSDEMRPNYNKDEVDFT